ncbi:hypothetical protein BJ165DRAFT_1399722 [Panaeolus papilionaceus]|nr:hypothetical protein BJ165DRAFT_1399722 [Panaeolus papilionaceus]
MTKADVVGTMRSQNRALLTAPTSPRLTKLMKECLSIEKWAEASQGWHAPGHVPWEGVPEPISFSWIPEGSVYSRETFVKALRFSRSSRAPLKHDTESLPPKIVNGATVPSIDDVFRPSEQEILDMMNELRHLRSYFQDSLQSGEDSSGQARKSTHVAGATTPTKEPAALQSPTLASRRGKKPPSRLFLSKKQKPKDLSYPSIPTAFLGSPTHHDSRSEPNNDDHDTKSTMNAQDMIQNLRSQCSAMLVQKPTQTTTKELPTAPEYPAATTENLKASAITSNSVKKVSWGPTGKVSSANLKSAPTKVHRVPPPKVDSDRGKSLGCSKRNGVILNPALLKSPANSPPRVSAPPPTDITPSPLANLPPKTVRFKTLPMDAKDAIVITSEDDSQSPNSGNELSDQTLKAVGFHESALRYKGMRGISRRLPPPGSKSRNAVSQPVISVPWKNDDITTSKIGVNYVTTVPMEEQMSFLQSTQLVGTKEPRSACDISPYPVQHASPNPSALGRNSLSRIIRGPVFSAPKEIKRETVCMGPKISGYQPVDNRPSSEIMGISAEKRKSRMPAPLRNIFTRFK